MRALITGAAGFAGRHLAMHLARQGDEVFGLTRATAPPIAGLAADHLLHAEIADGAAVAQAVAAARPAVLFHLAGLTFVPRSHDDPTAAVRTNVLGTIAVLAGVRQQAPRCRVVVVGSGDAYGRIEPAELPITESCCWRPLSPYAASKAAADLVAYQWGQAYGLDIVRLRPFNHTGPGQRPDFVCADFARQLIAIERGLRPARLTVGNLEAVRDFSDVRDIVAGYELAARQGVSGEAYNLCSGVGRPIRAILDELIELSGVRVEVTVAADKLRPVEVPRVVGSAEKLHAATGWRVAIPWQQTLADLLADWRARPAAQLS